MPALLRLSDLAATRDQQLTLGGGGSGLINDSHRAAASSDGFGRDGAYAGVGRTAIYPSQQNTILNSDCITDTSNTGANGATTVTRETTASKCPLGSTSAKTVTTGAGASEGIFYRSGAGTAAAADVWSGRGFIYHEAGVARNFLCRITWRDSSNASISDTDGATISVPSGVKTELPIYAKTAPASTDRVMIKIVQTDVVATTFWTGGVMAVKSSVIGPSIATDGAAASSTAGRCQVPWDAGLFTATQGWIVFLNRMGWANTAAPSANASAFAFGNDSTNRLALQYDGTSAQDFRRRNTGGAGLNAGGPSATFAVGGVTMFLASWTASGILAAADGGAIAGNANTTIPTVTATSFDIGSTTGLGLTGREWGADFLWFVCGNGPITSAQSAALFAAFGSATKPKPTIRALDQIARGAHATAVWDGRTGTFQRRIGA